MQLDDLRVIRRADPEDALGVIGQSAEQLKFEAEIQQPENFSGHISNVVLSGMGGSCLAGLMAKNWLDNDYNLSVPFEINRDYTLPNFVSKSSLVICFSVSGNTEETISALSDAIAKKAHTVVITSGGKLLELAQGNNIPYIKLAKITQPRYGVFMHLRAISKFFEFYKLVKGAYYELSDAHDFAQQYAQHLSPVIAIDRNQAKQIALYCSGKTVLVYTSRLLFPLAYKWKTSFNENAKNTIWCNEFPEFNHNEFVGWTSHPIDKPFAVINLRSSLDNPRISRRLDLTEQLLSGYRPTAHNINLTGNSLIRQMICGAMLADFSSIYLGIINGVDPTLVELVEKFKKELDA